MQDIYLADLLFLFKYYYDQKLCVDFYHLLMDFTDNHLTCIDLHSLDHSHCSSAKDKIYFSEQSCELLKKFFPGNSSCIFCQYLSLFLAIFLSLGARGLQCKYIKNTLNAKLHHYPQDLTQEEFYFSPYLIGT